MNPENEINILLVDDEVKFLTAVADRLALKGFNVTTATDGDAAIEAAGKGTLFLDEIGDMPMSLQAKLLQVIQSGEGPFQSETHGLQIFAADQQGDLLELGLGDRAEARRLRPAGAGLPALLLRLPA